MRLSIPKVINALVVFALVTVLALVAGLLFWDESWIVRVIGGVAVLSAAWLITRLTTRG